MLPSKERKKSCWFSCECFANSAPVRFYYARKTKRTSRERGIVSSDDCWCATGTTTTTTIGVHASSINQSINRFQEEEEKKTRRVVVYKIAPFSRRENPPRQLLDDGLLRLLLLSTPSSFSSSPSRGPLSSSSSSSSSLFLLECDAPIFYRRERRLVERDE